MTPSSLARRIVDSLSVENYNRILEPSCGDGAFLSAIIDKILNNPRRYEQDNITEVIGVEIDSFLSDKSRTIVESKKVNDSLAQIKVYQSDFFKEYIKASSSSYLQHESFDLIVGNPPFGGTFDHSLEDILDMNIGTRLGKKIKKETYAFFIVACLDLLRPGGRLVFVCSDTLMTIPTMTGLRHLLMRYGDVNIHDIATFSPETNYPMVILDFVKRDYPGRVTRNSTLIASDMILSTPNLSWGITPGLSKLFSGPMLGDYFIASSGMTTGKNKLFVREINESGQIIEPYIFEFYDAPITLEYELKRARLGKLSARRKRELEMAEALGETQRRVRVTERAKPLSIEFPNPSYRPYNKANNMLIFSNPTHCIFWENEGDAVLTYKKTGNWYLRGVGGQPYFGREGVTWPLVANRFNIRYMPEGYILDSGSPCAFVRSGVPRDELFFIIGWLLSDLANHVLKTVINHTRNIQSKDFERMPYPWWVSDDDKSAVIDLVKYMIHRASEGKLWSWNNPQISELNDIFDFPENNVFSCDAANDTNRQLAFDAFGI